MEDYTARLVLLQRKIYIHLWVWMLARKKRGGSDCFNSPALNVIILFYTEFTVTLDFKNWLLKELKKVIIIITIILPPHQECPEPGWSPAPHRPGPLWNRDYLHGNRIVVNTDLCDLYSYLLFQSIIFNQIVQGFTGVSLIISDEAPRQESHHQRCKKERNTFP